MLKSEAAAYLAGLSSEDNSNAASPTNVHTISGEVVEDSVDGSAKVSIDGMMFSEEDDQYIEVDTVGGLKAGDVVTMLISGEDGHGMTPLAIGAVGSVDRLGDEVAQIDAYAQAAQSSAQSAAASAEEAASNAEASAESALLAQSNAETSALAAQQAETNASTSADAAQQAATSAESAADSASDAQLSAEEAAQDANQARQEAEDAARSSAESAQSALEAETYAEGAMLGLSQVENVLDTLDWIEKHATKTTDTTAIANKKYYHRPVMYSVTAVELDSGYDPEDYNPSELGWSYPIQCTQGATNLHPIASYFTFDETTGECSQVTNIDGTEDPGEEGWYTFAESTDTIADNPPYYIVENVYEGGLTPVPDEFFEKVPAFNPSGFGLYEFNTSVTEYMASHLAQTDYGLNIMADGVPGYLHLGSLDGDLEKHENGVYVIDETGVDAAHFGVHTRIGRQDGLHIDITSDIESDEEKEEEESEDEEQKLFSIRYGEQEPVMYVAVDSNKESIVYMTKAVVVKDIRFGNWMWYERENNNMSIKWVGPPEPEPEETEGGDGQ